MFANRSPFQPITFEIPASAIRGFGIPAGALAHITASDEKPLSGGVVLRVGDLLLCEGTVEDRVRFKHIGQMAPPPPPPTWFQRIRRRVARIIFPTFLLHWVMVCARSTMWALNDYMSKRKEGSQA